MEKEKELEPFLPSAEEFEDMSLGAFAFWVQDAKDILEKREIRRNPLFYLKQEISEMLKDNSLSEVEKEKKLLKTIVHYYREQVN